MQHALQMAETLHFGEVSAEQSHFVPHQEWAAGVWNLPVEISNQGPHEFVENTNSTRTSTMANEVVRNTNKGAISTLQEFVQCSKDFRSPGKRSIIQWNMDETMMCTSSPSFRATVAFLLDGVPHHAVGEWKSSKQLAKNDAAERALQFFVGSWGAELLQWMQQASEERLGESTLEELVELHQDSGGDLQAVKILEKYCERNGYAPPSWRISWEGNTCKALAEIGLRNVPHHFVGEAWENEDDAYASTAARILFYLNCPGFKDLIEFNPAAPAVNQPEIPAPPKNWMGSEPTEQDLSQLAERKIFRVQNRLQRIFAKDYKAGQNVWEWGDYEIDRSCPPKFRISLYIPNLDKQFTGSWKHDQKQAHLDTCGVVNKFLDQYESMQKNTSEQWLRARH
mmetsp:Transcript_36890/g.59166  ORF Transcript_36890/g.59166 Transcript_36890/m.59166 type:complete len:396 (+) Transcript_36890:127-1314(+)